MDDIVFPGIHGSLNIKLPKKFQPERMKVTKKPLNPQAPGEPEGAHPCRNLIQYP